MSRSGDRSAGRAPETPRDRHAPEAAGCSDSLQPRDIVEILGGHVSSQLALDLDEPDDATLGRWLIAAALHDSRQPDEVTRAACEALRAAGCFDVESMAAASPADVEQRLGAAGVKQPEAVAPRLVRVARALLEHYDGKVHRLAGEAQSLEELAARLSRLAPGFGRAAVVRFLTPIRNTWHVASDLPATPAACAAATDLGFAPPEIDPSALPSALERTLAEAANAEHEVVVEGEEEAGGRGAGDGLQLRDLEAALDRLGRAACLRGRTARCPLGDACPKRGEPT
jgi:endonuclease III